MNASTGIRIHNPSFRASEVTFLERSFMWISNFSWDCLCIQHQEWVHDWVFVLQAFSGYKYKKENLNCALHNSVRVLLLWFSSRTHEVRQCTKRYVFLPGNTCFNVTSVWNGKVCLLEFHYKQVWMYEGWGRGRCWPSKGVPSSHTCVNSCWWMWFQVLPSHSSSWFWNFAAQYVSAQYGRLDLTSCSK
jgi:hypothetical protein